MPSVRRNLFFLLAGVASLPAMAQDAAEPLLDPEGVPYAWIDAAPVLGVIKAYNASFGFAVASLPENAGPGLRRGHTVAARRDGVIVAAGVIDTLEDSRTMVVQFPVTSPEALNPSRPRVGDEIIPYPPPPPSTPPK